MLITVLSGVTKYFMLKSIPWDFSGGPVVEDASANAGDIDFITAL